jgi:hypothetical protein
VLLDNAAASGNLTGEQFARLRREFYPVSEQAGG